MLREGPLDIAMTNVPDGFPVHRNMSETAGGFAFTDIVIVAEDGEPVPDGVTGELLIRGVGVMAGYNKRERGDTFTELIKSAGANVSPLEVESVIGEFAGVAQCVVVGIDDPVRGEEVCAVVVPSSADVNLKGLADDGREQLSGYKVPTLWAVVAVDEIPTLPSGKFNRKALRALVGEGAIPSHRPRDVGAGVRPEAPGEASSG